VKKPEKLNAGDAAEARRVEDSAQQAAPAFRPSWPGSRKKGAAKSSYPGPAAGVAPRYECRLHSRAQWSISPEPEETP
jgi:hypothetical protein